jgi:hypothetical protein
MKSINIFSDYKVLHFDEYPILFVGKNETHHNIIGSFLYENEDNNTLMFFHSIVSNALLLDFFQQKISYHELLKKAESIYKVEKNYNTQIIRSEKVKFTQIDKSILPLPSAYCPVVDALTPIVSKAVAY